MRWSLFTVLLLHSYQFVDAIDCFCPLCELDKLPDNCTTIYGHIQMGLESTMPPFEIVEYKLENVTKIVGCVTIANSGFTNLLLFSNLQVIQYSQNDNASTCSSYGNGITIAKNSLLRRLYFTSLEKVIVSKKSEYGIYIVDNPSLCITEEELEQFMTTSKFYAPHIQICNPTKMYCRLDDFDFFDDTNIAAGCQVLTDSLVLNGTTNENSTEFQRRLNDVEQILGSIIVLGTDIVSLEFPNLWRIYNFQPELPVILLQNNPNLCEVNLSNLSSIPYFGTWPDVLYAFQNPLLTQMSADTCGHLLKLGEITFEDSAHSICDNQTTSVLIGSSAELLVEPGKTGNSSVALNSGEKNKPPNNDTKDNANFQRYANNFIFSFIIYLSRSSV
ncbi:unnamed protein product [Caenorhabditis sp. 36 PRJEB53466]|nr:unnamed protein product [Caenorhabditis sp. 36 PRJEB53466]